MIKVTFTTQRNKTIDNPNDIEPTVYNHQDSRCPIGSNEYKLLDTIIIEHYATHTVNELVEITGVYKARVLWRIKFLMENGYIQPKSRIHLTKEQKQALRKQISANKKAIKSAMAKLNRAA